MYAALLRLTAAYALLDVGHTAGGAPPHERMYRINFYMEALKSQLHNQAGAMALGHWARLSGPSPELERNTKSISP
ncbi:hypothetical protein LY78DRAFT_661666 [Colletotrichum sublineola]|nr:hypothetical protein LY78DRAFT_661666 [Colletotrichum sublineola]